MSPAEKIWTFEKSEKKAVKDTDGWHVGTYVITVLVNSVELSKGDTLKYMKPSFKEKYPKQDNLKKRPLAYA